MFRAFYHIPIVGLRPTRDFSFNTGRKTSIGDDIIIHLEANKNKYRRVKFAGEVVLDNDCVHMTHIFKKCDSQITITGDTFTYFDMDVAHAIRF